MLQQDYDSWRAAKDAYLAELKPLVTEESYQRVCGHAENEVKDKLFAGLIALENMLYQAKEQATPVDVRFSVTENALGPPQFHYITPNGEGVMDMFGNVLNVVKGNSLFSAETKKVQNYAKENKDGFVDKMNELWAEAHTKSTAGQMETWEVNTNSIPVSIKESDEQIRADNDAVLEALRKRSSTSSSAPGSAAAVEPKKSAEQIRAENNKILDALRKTNSDITADDELNRAWAALSPRQRNRLRQAEREWIKQRDAIPKTIKSEKTSRL
jgi:uncharacterized protein YecT (DUF1311 family)